MSYIGLDFFFYRKKIYPFILFYYYYYFFFFWLCWVFVAVHGLSLVAARGGYSVAVRGLLIAVASLVAEHRL